MAELEKTVTCKNCGREIGFVKTIKGKWMPVDPVSVRYDELPEGTSLITPEGDVFKNRPDYKVVISGFPCHFDTCEK